MMVLYKKSTSTITHLNFSYCVYQSIHNVNHQGDKNNTQYVFELLKSAQGLMDLKQNVMG